MPSFVERCRFIGIIVRQYKYYLNLTCYPDTVIISLHPVDFKDDKRFISAEVLKL